MPPKLDSSTLPPGKKIAFNLSDTARLADTKKNPIIIKEDVDYKSVALCWLRIQY
jgi:Rho GDP-dissociation inhibitor